MNEPRYTIMTGADAEELVYAVNEAIAGGWEAQGGVAIIRANYDDNTTEWTWAQAMVRK